jgi:hypothetical protein
MSAKSLPKAVRRERQTQQKVEPLPSPFDEMPEDSRKLAEWRNSSQDLQGDPTAQEIGLSCNESRLAEESMTERPSPICTLSSLSGKGPRSGLLLLVCRGLL